MATPPASQPSLASPIVPVTSAHGSKTSAELPVRGVSAFGVSSDRGNPVIDLTTSCETGPGSGPFSRTSSLRQPSSPCDTTSDATIKSSSVDQATMDPVSTLVVEQVNRHHNEHIHLARLIAFALTQPPEPSDSTQRQAILHAESASALVDILRGRHQPPNSSAELAQLRVDLHSTEASNTSFQKRLGSALDQDAQLKLQLETSERECHIWRRETDKLVGLITSLRKALTTSGAELKQAQTAQSAEVTTTRSALHAAELMIKGRDEEIAALSKSIVERDEAYKILQEIVLSLDDDGSHKLFHAKKTINEMRETILRQNRVIGRQGFVPMHDPHMAAGAGLGVPGMDPASLKLNARFCRLLAERFPEVMQIPDGEDRVVELRICSRQSGSAGVQVSASSSAAIPTPGSSSAAALPPSSSSAGTHVPLRHRPLRSIEALRRVRKDKLTPSHRLSVLANTESATTAGPRKRKVVLPPLQSYGQPSPEEEGFQQ
ncbi:Hypothetical protein PHPALM_8836 [Phytophthora palmivora]|uniref:Uncharacterized protein n=1 Tax=Phytophthora palmivora TaxID=4796 RepID=A0A2P4Y8V7_9STRA|nr:Hypothetical protein PHPALM_8836 [Phytophthora palmivora]